MYISSDPSADPLAGFDRDKYEIGEHGELVYRGMCHVILMSHVCDLRVYLLCNGVLAAGFFLAVAFLTHVAGDDDLTTAFLLTTILTILSRKRLKGT